jgi:Xaa-Pro aminopeptidase
MARPERLRALRRLLRGVDGLLVTNIPNIRYLTGFTGSSGYALITRERSVFLTDFRYMERAGEEVRGPWEVQVLKGGLASAIKALSIKAGIERLGFEASVSYQLFESLKKNLPEVRALRGTVERLRAVKDPGEIAYIKEAVARAEAAFLDVKPHIRVGARERSIARRLAERLRRHGSGRIPFDIIVASGRNSARPHAGATEKRLEPGDLVVLDWGGEAGGYFSDMTRTVLLKGPGLGGKKEIYALVLEANRKGVAAARAGAGSRDVDSSARSVIRNAGYGECFGHALGHGVGLEVHEMPRLDWRRNTTLREGMVFTVEPGIYVSGLGGVRIEDMVAVAPRGGGKPLTSLRRELEIIS